MAYSYRPWTSLAHLKEASFLLPKDPAWLPTFLEKCRAFPHGKHDDRINSMSQFLNWRDWLQQNRVWVIQQ